MRLQPLCWIAVTGLPVYASADALTLLTTQAGSWMLWNSGYRRRALPASVLVFPLVCALVCAVEAAERAGEHAAKTAARAVQVSEGAPIPERSAVSCGITDERGLQAPAQRRRFFFVLPRHAESGGGGGSSSVGGRDEAQALRPRRRAREREAERQRLSQHTGQRGLGLSRLRRLAFGLPVSVAPSLSLKAKPAPVSSANDDGGGLARCVQRAKPRECVRALVCAHNARTHAENAHSEALY